MAAAPKPTYTEAAYLALERHGEVRHEYYAGEFFAMVGASEAHNLISPAPYSASTVNCAPGLAASTATTCASALPRPAVYTYPDLIVACGESRLTDDTFETLENPTVIIEILILSESIERHDRGKKFQHYRALASLREYLLIAQDAAHIGRFVREGDSSWCLTEANGIAAISQLPAIDCALPPAEVCEKVLFSD